jgi:hypothetical protein
MLAFNSQIIRFNMPAELDKAEELFKGPERCSTGLNNGGNK